MQRRQQTEDDMWMELEEYIASGDSEKRTSGCMNAKIWQVAQSSNTKAKNLENDFNETAATIWRLAGVMVKRRPHSGSKKKRRVREGGQVLQELLLMSSVSWSGQSCRYLGPFDGKHLSEWIPPKDMVMLDELSSTVCAVSQEWLGDQILDSLGDQT